MGSGVQHNCPIVLLASRPRLFPHTTFQEHVFARIGPQSRPPTKQRRRRQWLKLGVRAANDTWAQPYASAPFTGSDQPEFPGPFSYRALRFSPPLPLLTASVNELIYVYGDWVRYRRLTWRRAW